MKEENESRREPPENPIRPSAPGISFESAAHDTAGSALSTPGHDATVAERGERISRETRRLKEWADENGKLGGKLPTEDTRGGEHTVQIDSDKGVVYKATRPETNRGYGIAYGSYDHGATPGEYLDRMATHNRIFEDDIKLERVVPVSGGKLSIVMSQPLIKGTDATVPQVDALMHSKGFNKIAAGIYHHPDEHLLVSDLKPSPESNLIRNAKVGSDGIVHPIDPVIQRVTPDFAEFVGKNPHLFDK